MKRMTALLIAVFAISSFGAEKAASSSSSGGGGMSAGFHAGLNIAKITGDTPTDSKIGFKIGGQLETQLMDWLYLQPELAFTMKGGKTTIATVEIKSVLNYIDLPILFKAKFDAGGWSPYLLFGPHIGIAMTRTVADIDASASTKSLDFGLHIGAGAGVPVGDGMTWFLDGRLEMGLANLNSAGTATAKNQNISFNTGLNFAM